MMRKTRIITLVLAVFCGFYITVNFFWLKVSVNTPPWDEATHAYIISVFSKYLDGHTLWSLLLNKDILLIDTRYPKFMHLVIATLNSPFPVKNIGSMVLIMDLVFLPILVFSVFAIGRRMCNEKAGFLAAFLVAIYPFSIAASRHISLDFPLISWAALMIYAFILSDDFRRPIFSIFFGVTLGLGLLIKQSFIFFVIPVIVYFLARVFSEKQEKALILRQVYNLCASLFPCLLICGWWYFYSFTNTHGGDNLSVHYYKLFNPLHRFLHWRGSVKYYPQVLIYQISWPLSIIFMLSLLPYIESSLKYKYLPVIFIFFSLFMYSFFFIKDARYIVPIFSGFALVTSIGVSSIVSVRLRRFTVWLIVLIGLLNFYEMASGKPLTNLFQVPLRSESAQRDYSPYPLREEWGMEGAIAFLKKESAKAHLQQNEVVVLTAFNHNVYNFQSIRYYNEERGLQLNVIGLPYVDDPVGMLKSRQYDFVLFKDKKNVGFELKKLKEIGAFIGSNPDYLSVAYKIILPDQSSLIIYRCKRNK